MHYPYNVYLKAADGNEIDLAFNDLDKSSKTTPAVKPKMDDGARNLKATTVKSKDDDAGDLKNHKDGTPT